MSDNQYPVAPKWLVNIVNEYGVAGGREPNYESSMIWPKLVQGINRFVRESIDADRAQRKPLSDDLCDTITHAVIQEYKFGYPEYHDKFKEECRTAIRAALGMKAKP